MVVDMERLIEVLVDDISCHGDLGCPVSRILDKIDQFYPAANSISDSPPDATAISPRQAAWDWVKVRRDVSIGKDRAWNHADLYEILAFPEEPVSVDQEPERTDASPQEDRAAPVQARLAAGAQYRPKVFVSEEQMWQSIAGHGADFKRVPKLEWAALVGIASTKKDGILQGDLCRLIGQDKRSLPKRTDSLAQKGYILKRTTLVRGVKTSKMWLSRCAPSLSSDHLETELGGHGQDTALLMPPESFNRDMEPVAWRKRWTGGSIDMLSLAETVISVVRAFGIMRYHDLRQKLGILNLPWQMKVTARLCRWAVRRGILQYVGATLGDRLYKDCLKFIRDFTSEDWVEWLRTGKEKSRPKTDADLDAYRDNPTGDTTSKRKRTNKADNSINVMIAWKPEKPLPTTVLDAIRAADGKAVTNRHLGAHTLGPPFSRYVTSISTTLATPSLQPPHLAHFQVSKELMRVKKQAIYFFSLPRLHPPASNRDRNAGDNTVDSPGVESSSRPEVSQTPLDILDNYFSSTTGRAACSAHGSLSNLARMTGKRDSAALTKANTHSTPIAPESATSAKGTLFRASDSRKSSAAAVVGHAVSLPQVVRQAPGRGRGHRGRRVATLVLTFTVTPASLARILLPSQPGLSTGRTRRGPGRLARAAQVQPNADQNSALSPLDPHSTGDSPAARTQAEVDIDDGEEVEVSGALLSSLPDPTAGRRGRGRTVASSKKPRSSKAKSFRCDKCGGVWQNDNGLKYHLEKSSSACNPNYSAPPPKPPRYLSSRISLLSNTGTPDAGNGEAVPTRRTRTGMAAGLESTSPARTPRGNKLTARVSSAFQHAPSLRARAKYPASFDQAAELSIPQAEGGPRVVEEAAPRYFQALLRDTSATLSNTTPERVDETAKSAGDTLGYTRPRRREVTKEMTPLQSSTTVHETTEPSSNHSPHEGSSGSAVVSQAYTDPPSQDAASTQDNLDSHSVPMQRPFRPDKSKSSNQRHNSQFHRSSQIIQHLLDVHGGVIPGERSLWHALTAVWEKTYPADSPPNYGTTQGLVGKMVGRKVFRKSVHAFRDLKGSFKSVTLLLTPSVDSQSAAALDLKDKMIAMHPQTYVLPGYTPKSGLPDDTKWNGIPVFSTRRQLAQNVEVLDAPFYASRQASRKRPRAPDASGQGTRRRQQYAMESFQNSSIIADDDARGPYGGVFVGGHGVDFIHQHQEQPILGPITFLEPNTQLEDEVCLPEKPQPPRPRKRRVSKHDDFGSAVFNGMVPEQSDDTQFGVHFVEPTLLPRTEGKWPCLSADFFEHNPSAAMQGSLLPNPRSLAHLLPCGLADIVGPQWLAPHEATLEASHHLFMQQVELCAAWETDPLRGAQLAGMQPTTFHHIWISHTMSAPIQTYVYRKLSWIKETPGPLSDGDPRRSRPAGMSTRDMPFENGSPAKRRKLNEGASRSAATVLPMDLKTRKMTPWNGTNETGQIAIQGRHLDANNDAVLIAAFVATRTLLGGADKYVEWGLLLRLFPNKSLAWLRKFWSKARKDRTASINKLTERFQERFGKAYEQGELPLIDFDDYLNYDWTRLVQWTLELAGDAIQLPSSVAELEREYIIDGLSADTSDWQRIYYSFQSSTFNRLEALTSGSTCTPVDQAAVLPPSTSEEELRKAKSWLRALCGTPSGTYKPADIRQKLCCITNQGDSHNNTLLGQAIAALQNQNVITKTKQRQGDSGSHRFTEWFMPRFDKISQAHKYNDAVVFKAMLDDMFRKNEAWRVPYLLQDGEVMAMINMQAAGRIKVTPVDVPHIPLGFKPGFYESRKFPKSFYNFGLEVTPTNTYIFNEDLTVLVASLADTPPSEGPAGKLPIWCDIFGKLAADRWGRTVRAVAFAVAMRGPLSTDGMLSALAPFLEDFEIDLVLDWGLRHGLLKKTEHGRTYTADEWWWLLAGSQYHELLSRP
ncbi:hypothetical protein F5X68DRAFT_153528 [Plectosphaerella plurivora]|uniref:Uncharacterized protein n=1 Tax=Plectosphaerella plurivora TaxID=936078 RepID=A0A9P8VAI0_9PEZI|nr:hypothetical protein F5X68DRAFT_153528 [Plectosphaerella plurivora]